jgi:hypothetical protein
METRTVKEICDLGHIRLSESDSLGGLSFTFLVVIRILIRACITDVLILLNTQRIGVVARAYDTGY